MTVILPVQAFLLLLKLHVEIVHVLDMSLRELWLHIPDKETHVQVFFSYQRNFHMHLLWLLKLICLIYLQTKCSKEGEESLNANLIWLLGQHNEIQEHKCVYIRIYVLYLLVLTPEAKHSS